jgi:predicted Zn-dependent protease
MVDTRVLLDRATLLERGCIRDDETAARQILSKEPCNEEVLALLGRCACAGGHFKDGTCLIEPALALRPENSIYYSLLAFGFYP